MSYFKAEIQQIRFLQGPRRFRVGSLPLDGSNGPTSKVTGERSGTGKGKGKGPRGGKGNTHTHTHRHTERHGLHNLPLSYLLCGLASITRAGFKRGKLGSCPGPPQLSGLHKNSKTLLPKET